MAIIGKLYKNYTKKQIQNYQKAFLPEKSSQDNLQKLFFYVRWMKESHTGMDKIWQKVNETFLDELSL